MTDDWSEGPQEVANPSVLYIALVFLLPFTFDFLP